MTKEEALKLALEALETPWNAPYVDGCDLALGKRVKAITAIKEALAQEQEQDGECKYCTDGCPACDARKLPAQRTWAGLTDEDLKLLSAEWRIVYGAWMDDFAQDIEAKLKEKNT